MKTTKFQKVKEMAAMLQAQPKMSKKEALCFLKKNYSERANAVLRENAYNMANQD